MDSTSILDYFGFISLRKPSVAELLLVDLEHTALLAEQEYMLNPHFPDMTQLYPTARIAYVSDEALHTLAEEHAQNLKLHPTPKVYSWTHLYQSCNGGFRKDFGGLAKKIGVAPKNTIVISALEQDGQEALRTGTQFMLFCYDKGLIKPAHLLKKSSYDT